MDEKILTKWLEEIDDDFRAKNFPPRNRPWEAMSKYSKEFKTSLELGSPIAKYIFNWFEKNSKAGTHHMGNLFTGCFCYDATFWPLEIPIFFGEVNLSPFDFIGDIPARVKESLMRNHSACHALTIYWSDCLDYALGYEFMISTKALNDRAILFFSNAHKELVGAITQLLSPKPNLKAILSLRMASEIFMKGLLVHELKLNDKQLKKLSHNLSDISKECFNVTGDAEYVDVANHMHIFPDISYRYEGGETILKDVWLSLCITQRIASTITRRYSPHDIRPQLFPHA